MPLTKTEYLLYREAPAHLWAAAHGRIPQETPSANALHLMRQGLAVEPYARQFIEQVLLPAYQSPSLAWQATYSYGPFEARADALVLDEATGEVDLYEIKAVNAVDEGDTEDVAYQALILRANLRLRRCFLIHLNKEYVRNGEIEVQKLFVVQEVTEEVARLEPQVAEARVAALAVAEADAPPPEGICLKPAVCPCPDVCHPALPAFPIYSIPRLQARKSRELRSLGILDARDVPDDYPLSEAQRRVVSLVQGGRPVVRTEEIRQTLAGLSWPLWFLDYETFNASLPLFDGYGPYKPIVFQVSVHILSAVDAEPRHHEFLGLGPNDPSRPLAESLERLSPRPGTVVVWNQSFETTRNREMAERYPGLADSLQELNDRVFDLMTIFSRGFYMHPGFGGSSSIKRVLPVLLPGFTYEGLAVADGSQAMLAWHDLHHGKVQGDAREQLKEALLDYCRLDTLAMVEIFRFLSRIDLDG